MVSEHIISERAAQYSKVAASQNWDQLMHLIENSLPDEFVEATFITLSVKTESSMIM